MINPNIEDLKVSISAVTPISVEISGTESVTADISAEQGMNVSPSIGAGGGTDNYEQLRYKPSINSIELKGDKTGKQLGLQDQMSELTNLELDELINFD